MGFNREQLLNWNGETKSIAEWSEVTGLPTYRIIFRLHRGWLPDRALKTEIKRQLKRELPPVKVERSKACHGLSRTKAYRTWQNMLHRCYDPKHQAYPNYGGRGILVCDRWRYSFENFHADMGDPPDPKMCIDRIKNDQGYSKENCRWSTIKENLRNKRTTLTAVVEGQCKPIAEWAEIFGLPYLTVRERLRSGWDIDRALKTPLKEAHSRVCSEGLLRRAAFERRPRRRVRDN